MKTKGNWREQVNLQKWFEKLEGREHKAYLDTEGIPTIGIGHTGPEVHLGLIWTDEQIDKAFAKDYKEAADGVTEKLPWFIKLNDARKAVFISMAFQMGVDGLLEFKHTLAAARDERFAYAASMMLDSKWARQTPNRARAHAHQIETGEWQ